MPRSSIRMKKPSIAASNIRRFLALTKTCAIVRQSLKYANLRGPGVIELDREFQVELNAVADHPRADFGIDGW